jgi:hypothetical protein
MISKRVARVVAVGGALLAAAGQASCAAEVTGADAERRTEAHVAATPQLPERVPSAAPPATGEAPAELVASIREDVVRRAGTAPGELQLVRDEAVTWQDGSLGCPRPGEVYPQVLVHGFWIVFRAAGREFDYRVDSRGRFRLCESPTVQGPHRPNPTQ